jgi:RNA-directed DNA polymerase
MDQTDQIDKWKEFLETAVRGEVTKAVFLRYVENLLSKNLPIIFELDHLSSLLGINEKTLASAINSPSSFYRTFEIPKRTGGVREISSPYPVLLSAQRWIYDNILKTVPTHDCAYGFVEGRSIVDNARAHLNCLCLLKMDIKDFFPSVDIRRIQDAFHELGYSDKVSYDLASICCLDKCLPQGGATSPYLSNIIARGLDKRLSSLANKWGLSYTRYADDMTFSGDYIPIHFIGVVSNVVEEEGFKANEGKTKLIRGRNKQKIVTGISVAGETLTLPKHTKRELRKEIHYLLLNGLLVHSRHIGISDPIYVERLVGRLEFWRQIEPHNEFVLKSVKSLRDYELELDRTIST